MGTEREIFEAYSKLEDHDDELLIFTAGYKACEEKLELHNFQLCDQNVSLTSRLITLEAERDSLKAQVEVARGALERVSDGHLTHIEMVRLAGTALMKMGEL